MSDQGTGEMDTPAIAEQAAQKPVRRVGNPVAAAKAANLRGPTNMHRQAPIGPHNMTLKQTEFVKGLLSGMNQSDAYRAAYDTSNMLDKSIHIEACKLMKHPKVRQALYEARHEAGRLLKITAETLTDMAVETYETAFEAGNAGQMTGAIAILAKINGLIVDRSERKIETVGDRKDRKEMVAELRKLTSALGISIVDVTAQPVTQQIEAGDTTKENDGGHDIPLVPRVNDVVNS